MAVSRKPQPGVSGMKCGVEYVVATLKKAFGVCTTATALVELGLVDSDLPWLLRVVALETSKVCVHVGQTFYLQGEIKLLFG